MDFLPLSVGVTLRLLSLSGSFQLLGARIGLDEKTLGVYRGPLLQYGQFIAAEYQADIMKSMASILGKSSLMNVPRAPIAAVGIISSAGFKSVAVAMDAVGGAFNELVLDEAYKQKQRELRDRKEINSLKQGVKEAGKRTVEIVEGLFDIFRQPFRGAREGGVAGFFEGVGRGIVGTVVKPVSKVGEAVSDLGTGVSKFASKADPTSSRPQILRMRLPRPFYGPNEVIGAYDMFDAVVYQLLDGTEAADHADAFLRVPSALPQADRLGVLILHIRRIVYVEIDSKDGLQSEVFWEVVVSLLSKVKVEGKHVILTDARDATCRCRLPEDENVSNAFLIALRKGIVNRVFDWSPVAAVKRGLIDKRLT